jgi:hypothetical protein
VEPSIHGIFRKLAPNNGNMLCIQKDLGVRHPWCARVATPYRARVAIRKETLLIEALEFIRHTGNGNVHEPRELEWVWHISTPRLNADTNVGSLLLQLFQQRRKQQVTRIIRYKQLERARAARRLEFFPD